MAHNMKERNAFFSSGGGNPLERRSGSLANFTWHHHRHLTEHGKIVRLIVAAAAVAVIARFANKLTTI